MAAVTAEVAALIQATGRGPLDPQLAAAARLVALDGLAVTVAGTLEDAPRIAAGVAKEMGGAPLSSVVGGGFCTSPTTAAFLNGIACHVLDYELMWTPPTHATSPTLPGILALAEWQGLGGREVVNALVAGCEFQGRLRLATRHVLPGFGRWHTPGLVGVMGAAASAARALDLTVDQTRHALGIAGSRTGALIANIGTMTKSSHCGNAARMGLEAALLARRGYTANPDVIETRLGFAEAIYGQGFDLPAVTRDWGSPYRMVDPGFNIKLFPCQYGMQFVIHAALALQRRHRPDPGAIAKVDVHMTPMPYVNRPEPRTGLDGKFSLQYVCAAALLDGQVPIATFHDARRFAPDMVALLPRICAHEDPAIPAGFDQSWVDVVVTMQDGRVLESRCDRPPGRWDNPVSRDDHLVKVRDCLGQALTPAETDRVIALIDRLEDLSPAEVGTLMDVLREARPAPGAPP